ncbi:hypothetical protein DPMN_147900 [Dreissena polymorpha]|uniref:Uncharacterized protein n=1 Tax=Dreissena polymorpha TaxID=45954 RepID=A0A9D4F9U9_DREPO|nr:hypothetical protein DPMN_147839 [Dreissena polymorpha]KAH3794367.1 hypothetical protein DPMN_147900 [Dreissena polymorpha]
MIGYISPANNHDLPEVPYIEEFQTFALDAYGIKSGLILTTTICKFQSYIEETILHIQRE